MNPKRIYNIEKEKNRVGETILGIKKDDIEKSRIICNTKSKTNL